VELLKSGQKSAENNPSVDELCMTTAYALSRMSSCLKRKVGAVIINKKASEQQSNTHNAAGLIETLPCIVSSGYNEVPLGSHKCVFHPDFQMCYRDHLQEMHARKFKHCPECGKKIGDVTIMCPQCGQSYNGYKKFCPGCQIELEDNYKCESCSSKLFKEFLPGEKNAPGKLLDMCRALHAEENALLNLVNYNNSNNNHLELYVTTQPCNLCANKIVSAGIKKVIFEEPYLMKESSDILRSGNVTVERFQGVKSSAFFKLYQQ
jgi:deoxycytidylate deaminase